MKTFTFCSILTVIIGVTFCASFAPQKSLESEHKENDPKRISKVLRELADLPDIQFVEYGPDDKDGYKYHLLADKDKQYVIHTDGPVFIPIDHTFGGSREEKDRKLLHLLIDNSKIKSMDSLGGSRDQS
ncbi:uncharacterized protein LOC129726922 [Wyeomyia smithii]|uniref:uncharacterized protein LOC129726922 n=1 Tax=Wyeomyia smithii TaxID=174621 RepID=UPI002467C404|nr:uncharacterized protein LOC129726922 [Wyeomyia smithii]